MRTIVLNGKKEKDKKNKQNTILNLSAAMSWPNKRRTRIVFFAAETETKTQTQTATLDSSSNINILQKLAY